MTSYVGQPSYQWNEPRGQRRRPQWADIPAEHGEYRCDRGGDTRGEIRGEDLRGVSEEPQF